MGPQAALVSQTQAECFSGVALPQSGCPVLTQEVKLSLASKIKGCETITWASCFKTKSGPLSGLRLHGHLLCRSEADA